MNRLALLCVVLIFFCASCDEVRLKKEVDRFIGTEITVPGGMECLLLGRNSVVPDMPGTCVRLVAYYDSTGCASCSVHKLDYWNKVVELCSATENRFMPVFIFSPGEGKQQETGSALRLTSFNYPVYLDTAGLFGTINQPLPENPLLHTFLLDRNNRVVLVGDPSANDPLWNLYVSTINGLLANNGILE